MTGIQELQNFDTQIPTLQFVKGIFSRKLIIIRST